MDDERTASAPRAHIPGDVVVCRGRLAAPLEWHGEKTSGLVDDNERLVFEDDLEVAGIARIADPPDRRCGARAARSIGPQAHDVSGGEAAAGRSQSDFLTVQKHLAAGQRGGSPGARPGPAGGREESVEASACVRRAYDPL